ncbi:phage tail sheath subtilisin-like domain-containing protein [Paraburkholderia atlantica]|uniref:phage tail sheath subtilisin-like domain-containing protein n=1 Tax=Paraburkholderia atlantica TaxID=2654982 RepID=UPI00161FAFFD|nr:phage tail sheath subtilisin-like domain-containing protein [Paraburkholderia atlantica]MBB5414107.1 phage tail sheath gpL-like [Paraburkholderia atlantica]
MTIAFKNIPSNLRVPLFYAELDNSKANTGATTQRALIIGQMTASGTGTANTPQISQGATEAKSIGGQGSMLALMTAAYRAADPFGEVWYLPLADDPSAIAATGTVAITAAPTANGTLNLYIAGQRVTLAVLSTQTTAQIATALAAAINAVGDLPVTAAATTTTVTLTAKNKGLAGNDIDIRLNYRGAAGGETTPTGMTTTITAMSGGATNPTLTTGLANLLDQPFDFIVLPYTDSTSLDAIKSFLSSTTGRWSWSKQIYGHAFAAYRGTLGALTTFGTGRNDEHVSVMGFNDSPSPAWIWAADVAGTSASALRADPARPLQTLALSTVLAPPLASRFALTDRNTLLWDGISTFTVAQDGTVAIENLITTYQLNSFGQADNSYLEVETLFTLAYVLRQLQSVVTSKYSRMKLAADGTRFAPGSAIVTPGIIKADLIAQYQTLEYNGFVQKSTQFAQGLIVQQNSQNPNRVDVLYPGVLIDQLRIFALLMQFSLS